MKITEEIKEMIEMVDKIYVDIETGSEVKVSDVGGMRYKMVKFYDIEEGIESEDIIALPHFKQFYKLKD